MTLREIDGKRFVVLPPTGWTIHPGPWAGGLPKPGPRAPRAPRATRAWWLVSSAPVPERDRRGLGVTDAARPTPVPGRGQFHPEDGRQDHNQHECEEQALLVQGDDGRGQAWSPTPVSVMRPTHAVAATRVADSLLQPRCDRPGPRRLEQRPESARSRPDCERRDPEAPRTERGLRFREHLFGTFPAQDRTRGSLERVRRQGGVHWHERSRRSTSSACVNASGLAPDTTSRPRRSRGGGQQLRRTLPKTAASLGAIDALDNSHGVTRHVARITRGEIWLPATPTPAWARTLIRQIEPHRPTT